MAKAVDQHLSQVVRQFHLEALPKPNLEALAKKWGVVSIDEQPIKSDGMLLPSRNGYKVVLSAGKSDVRKRFSLAHELGHLLLHKCGITTLSTTTAKHRSFHDPDPAEERLCDQIAAEILMPRMAFTEDGWMEGWSLSSLRTLAEKYATSYEATAMRMIDVMPEPVVMAVWKPSEVGATSPRLRYQHSRNPRYGVPSPSVVPSTRLQLIASAMNSFVVQKGRAPIVDTALGRGKLFDVPAEALAWGIGEYRQVMAYYYPERERARRLPDTVTV